jgi:hypothetical protein
MTAPAAIRRRRASPSEGISRFDSATRDQEEKSMEAQQTNGANGAAKNTEKRGPRMSLANVRRGKVRAPLKEVIYGPDGVGKTTFAAEAPAPVFLSVKRGTDHFDVARFPAPKNWQDVIDALRSLSKDPHEYKTLVIDDIDWIEPMVHAEVCSTVLKENGEKANHIEDYGFKKGYEFALPKWRVLTDWLDLLHAKGMNILILVHLAVLKQKNPAGDEYERWGLKLYPSAASLLREWSESVLFANFDVRTEKKSKHAKVKGISTGSRFLFTRWTASYDAKTRHHLPERLPLSFRDFAAAVERGAPADAAPLRHAVEIGISELTDEVVVREARDRLAKAGSDANELAKLNGWVSGKLDEQNDAVGEEG